MKLMLRRSLVLLVFSLMLLLGLTIFMANYFANAADWAHHPGNRHYFRGGETVASGTISDRRGQVLFKIRDGEAKFHGSAAVRTAVMHAVGDKNDNVATGAQVAFRKRLTGWDLLNGAYSFGGISDGSSGRDLTLNLDAELCELAYRELGGRRGAVGVYNYKTGEILCMVSSPSFDPEHPPTIEPGAPGYDGVYLNRLLSAAYTPGSVFKLVTATAALVEIEDIDEKVYRCNREMEIDGDKVTCMSACGDVTLKQALARSCNIAFAEIALELGSDKLQKYAVSAGFNRGLEVDGIPTVPGRVDIRGAKGADLAWAGIGQHTITANPLNFMAFMGAIANDGVSVRPRLIKTEGLLSNILSSTDKERMIPSRTAELLGAMMRNNTLSSYGEGNFAGLELCGKTGTAEVGGGQNPHAWFAGYLERDDYPLAFVVIIENGGFGSRAAAPVAANVLQAAVKEQ